MAGGIGRVKREGFLECLCRLGKPFALEERDALEVLCRYV
jgi:hypothetical protein